MRIPLSSLLCLSAVSVFLTGCTLQTTAVATPDNIPGTTISGIVHGGQQPILGAQVYLLTPNPTGYGGPGIAASAGNASLSLLNSSTGSIPSSIGYFASTNSTTGGFSVAGEYSCTTGFTQGSSPSTVTLPGNEQVYLYVLGGKPASDAATANTASGLLVALGPCNSPTTKVTINEITTIATAYAFAGFATDATHIGSSGSALALTNLNNAFATVANLANATTGLPTASTATMTTPVAAVYTLADILAACVNTNGPSSNGCSQLFRFTASAGATGTAPTDTATAAINLAHNPYPTAAGVSTLFGLIPSTGAPFTGTLTTQPGDFTLALSYTGGGLSSPSEIAVDASGDVWVTNPVDFAGSISKFANNGTAISSSSGYTGGGLSFGLTLAIDYSGNVWVANQDANSISKFSNAGAAISGSTGYTGGGLSNPTSLAIDTNGSVWVPAFDNTNMLSEFYSFGVPVFGSPYSGGGLNGGSAVAIDTKSNVWVASTLNNSVNKFDPFGNAISSSSGYTGGGLNVPVAIAIDAVGNVWSANYSGGTVSKFSATGTDLTGTSGYGTTGSFGHIEKIAIDSAGNVWISNSGSVAVKNGVINIGGANSSVAVLSSTGTLLSGSAGYNSSPAYQTYGLALDGSGNVWVANNSGNALIELVGAASPVVTPIAANLAPPYGTSAVNRP